MAGNDVDRAWDLMESVRFCMLSTWTGQALRSRPMGAFVRRKENAIWFFTQHLEVGFRRDDQVDDAGGRQPLARLLEQRGDVLIVAAGAPSAIRDVPRLAFAERRIDEDHVGGATPSRGS